MSSALGDEPFYVILKEKTGLPRDRLTDDVSLLDGLGIAGADGWELIDELTEAYSIDWGNFDPHGFFGPELAYNPFVHLRALFRRKSDAEIALERKFTVGHLKQVCFQGSWFFP